jgi:SAM-dependent methyltransferase
MQNVNNRCPCVVVVDEETGVLKAVSKCDFHVAALKQELGDESAHYHRLGAIDNPGTYWPEFEAVLGPVPPGNGAVLEIGCGTSPYAEKFLQLGYRYVGLDTSPFVVDWMQNKFGRDKIVMGSTNWDKADASAAANTYDIVLAAHCVEHFKNAPHGVKKMAQVTKPGGTVYIIVPNDEDLCNPDHLWFFNEETLRKTVEAAGLMVQRLGSQQIVPHEMFMYCKAAKL